MFKGYNSGESYFKHLGIPAYMTIKRCNFICTKMKETKGVSDSIANHIDLSSGLVRSVSSIGIHEMDLICTKWVTLYKYIVNHVSLMVFFRTINDTVIVNCYLVVLFLLFGKGMPYSEMSHLEFSMIWTTKLISVNILTFVTEMESFIFDSLCHAMVGCHDPSSVRR